MQEDEEITEKVELPLLTNQEILEMAECMAWLIDRSRMTRDDRENYAPVYKAQMDKCFGFVQGLKNKMGVSDASNDNLSGPQSGDCT